MPICFSRFKIARKGLLLLALSFCASGTMLSAEPISQNVSFHGIVKAIRAQSYFPYVFGNQSRPPAMDAPQSVLSPAEKIVWAASAPELSAQIDTMKIRFAKKGSETLDSFDMEFLFGPEQLIVRHSHPLRATERGGFQFRNMYKKKPLRMAYFETAKGPDVKFFLPPGEEDVQREAFAMCLREEKTFVDKVERTEYTRLVPSEGYRLVKLEAEGKVSASAQMISGLGAGYGLALLQSTPNLPPTKPHIDKTFSEDPAVSLFYSPQESVALKTSVEEDFGIAGFRAQTDFVNPAGYRRQSVRDSFVSVTPLSVADAQGFQFPEAANLDSLESCFLVLRRTREAHGYTKQEAPTTQGLEAFGGDQIVFATEN